MTFFPGAGCTDAEFAQTISDPNAPCKFFDEDTGEQIPTPSDPEDALDEFSIIDRKGAHAPRTQDWKFILSADYRMPITGRFELSFYAVGYVSGGYVLDVECFTNIVR